MYSSIILLPCFTYFNSTIFLNLSSPSANSLFIFSKNSPTISNSTTSVSKSSIVFYFHTSATSFYIYVNIYYTCPSTIVSLILIFKYNLYAIINPTTFFDFPSNVCSIATSTLDLVLDLGIDITFTSTFLISNNVWSCTCNVANYSYYC